MSSAQSFERVPPEPSGLRALLFLFFIAFVGAGGIAAALANLLGLPRFSAGAGAGAVFLPAICRMSPSFRTLETRQPKMAQTMS